MTQIGMQTLLLRKDEMDRTSPTSPINLLKKSRNNRSKRGATDGSDNRLTTKPLRARQARANEPGSGGSKRTRAGAHPQKAKTRSFCASSSAHEADPNETESGLVIPLTPEIELKSLEIKVYLKNVLVYVLVFCFDRSPTGVLALIMFLQSSFLVCFVLRFGLRDRRAWVSVVQELYLAYYYTNYSFYQSDPGNSAKSMFFVICYFAGLTISLVGFVFDFVDEHKFRVIPRLAWGLRAKR